MEANPKTRMLILDDEPIVCKRLKPAFEKLGYAVEVFVDSTEAMARIREKDFDIVITDLKMKGIDGLQFVDAVKAKSPETEVIVITGFATMETAKDSFKLGIFDFVAKPFKISDIRVVVEKAEQKRKASGRPLLSDRAQQSARGLDG
ncbi:MAG: response regulator [Desulfobacteraceae bacterium]|nr:response regulator [Desulfobacteraceae bacterium]